MLYLVTGTPGSGKTLNTIKFIAESKQFHEINGKKRDIYYFNIRDLDPSFGWIQLNEEQAKDWFNLPPASVIVFDEAYDIFPTKLGGKQSPEHVTRLATHRHNGYDIFLITQKAQGQVDTFVRGLINRHQHYARIMGSSTVNRYTWESCQLNTDSRSAKQLANVSTSSFDKKYFGKYHSADEHTHTLNFPWRTIITIVLGVLFSAFLFYLAYQSFADDDNQIEPQQNNVPTTRTDYFSSPQSRDTLSFSELHKPEINGLPWSAPIYKNVLEAKTWPRPAACAVRLSDNDCRCVSQQGTKIFLDSDICLSIVKNGFFDWTKEPAEASERGAASQTAPHAQSQSRTRPRTIYLHDSDHLERHTSSNRLLDPNVTRSNLHNRF